MSEFDHYAPSYDEILRDPLRDTFSSGSAFFHRRKWELIQRFFADRGGDTRDMDWLDVGCGQGELLGLGAPNFRRATGCDPSLKMLANGSGGALEVRLQNRPDDLPFPQQSFDFVTAVCVYHHVHGQDRELLTQSINHVLRPGGVFCMIEHNPWNPATRMIVSRCPVDVDAELLSAPTARRLMQAGRLTPVCTSNFLFLPEGLYKHLPKIEKVFAKVPAGGQYAVFGIKRDF